jgi:RNA recognition motif-containing protein
MPSKSAVPAVFVRGLAFTLNDEELAAHFSEIAPVKRAFVVRNRTTHESNGYGFVQL